MNGARAFDKKEVLRIRLFFTRRRDRALFDLAIATGARISESLALNWRHVKDEKGDIRNDVLFRRKHQKGKKAGRIIRIPFCVRGELRVLSNYEFREGRGRPDDPVFYSKRTESRLGYQGALKGLKRACGKAGVAGNISTHSTRKTFAAVIYKQSGHNIQLVREMLGHHNLSATQMYIAATTEEIEAAYSYVEGLLDEDGGYDPAGY